MKWHSNENYAYEVYECIDDNTTRYSLEKYCDTGQLPTDAIPVTIEPTKTDCHLDTYHETMYNPPAEPIYFDFRSFLKL